MCLRSSRFSLLEYPSCTWNSLTGREEGEEGGGEERGGEERGGEGRRGEGRDTSVNMT